MILCCGEALIDMIPGEMNSGQAGFVPHAGGAVFNTSIALGRLGIKTGLLTGLSTDLFGQVLEDALMASHVNTALSVRSDRPTTLAFVRLVNGHASYTFYDENSAGRVLDRSQAPSIGDEVNAMFFGGISLAVEPCADFYADLLIEQSGNKVVMIDPNIRPGFIRDVERYRVRLERMLRHSDVVKVSDEDLDWIVPGEAGLKDKAAKLFEFGVSVVLVTRGSEGATGFLASGGDVTVPSRKVTVADTVGAGDTFNAGFLASLDDANQLTKTGISSMSVETLKCALSLGGQAAAVTVSRAGANPPWRSELDI
ncbi:carbohydrate kinase family protein [Roseibium algae]|uniref:Carbohydrate kinase n=1 Tax=Roseibium algae TaxID=3123038 RepID=A0ABU8TG99_9HYPH